MVADSVISFYAGNGHDGNIAVRVGESVFILEFERIFGSRYFTRLLNPFSTHSEGISNEDIVNFLDYINAILINRGIFVSGFDVGLFDWETSEEVADLVRGYFKIKKVFHTDQDVTSHHKAHAAGSFLSSGFDDAIVFSYDGGGNDGTFCVYSLNKNNINFNQINPRFDNPFPTKYARMGNFIKELRKPELGDLLETSKHEHNGVSYPGKIMGLSAYGSFDQGLYDKIYKYFNTYDSKNLNVSEAYLRYFGDLSFNCLEGKEAYDMAFNCQLAFENIFIENFQIYWNNSYKNVCLTGGGALNVLLNERLSKTYEDVNFFVQPSPGDSGISYGMLVHYLIYR